MHCRVSQGCCIPGQYLDYWRERWRALQIMDEVLQQLETVALQVKKPKWCSMVPLVTYLGQQHNVQELKSFLGLLTYYSIFLPKWLQFWPLYRLLGKDVTWSWATAVFQGSEEPTDIIAVASPLQPIAEVGIGLWCFCLQSGGFFSPRYQTAQRGPLGTLLLSKAEKDYSQLQWEDCLYL